MGSPLPILLTALAVSLCSQQVPKPKEPPPKVTALVCTALAVGGEASVTVVGGPVACQGWADSEQAQGLLGEGDRLSLYALEAGALGEVLLTGDGSLRSQGPGDGQEYALEFAARITIPPEKRHAYSEAQALRKDLWTLDMLAAWSPGAREPTWVTGELVRTGQEKDGQYRRIVDDWLRAKGVSQSTIEKARIEQVVKADIDGDGRCEVFLSFGSEWGYTESGRSDTETFRYLVMRHVPRESQQAQTVVLDDTPWRTLWVLGLCDLDGDGVAEVVTGSQGIDYAGADLFRWRDDRFERMGGWWFGA